MMYQHHYRDFCNRLKTLCQKDLATSSDFQISHYEPFYRESQELVQESKDQLIFCLEIIIFFLVVVASITLIWRSSKFVFLAMICSLIFFCWEAQKQELSELKLYFIKSNLEMILHAHQRSPSVYIADILIQNTLKNLNDDLSNKLSDSHLVIDS